MIGGHVQDIRLDVDFVNGGVRKLFRSDKLPLLYWWETFNAMVLNGVKQGYTFVCPCRLARTRLVICMILKTRCNRSHYDCLMYDMDINKCFVILQSETKWVNDYKCDPLLPFDLLKVQE
jgi:hypothetical protein